MQKLELTLQASFQRAARNYTKDPTNARTAAKILHSDSTRMAARIAANYLELHIWYQQI